MLFNYLMTIIYFITVISKTHFVSCHDRVDVNNAGEINITICVRANGYRLNCIRLTLDIQYPQSYECFFIIVVKVEQQGHLKYKNMYIV